MGAAPPWRGAHVSARTFRAIARQLCQTSIAYGLDLRDNEAVGDRFALAVRVGAEDDAADQPRVG